MATCCTVALAFLANTISTSDAFMMPRTTTPHLSRVQFGLAAAASSGDEDENDPTGGCGEGFYKVKGEHGDVCVFDYEAASCAFKGQSSLVDEDYWAAFDSQNLMRKKFGMGPLTAKQYVAFESQVEELGLQVEQKKAAAAAARKEYEKSQEPSFVKNFMNRVFQDTCESNFDCEQPEVCCDFGFKKMCCSSGKTTKELRWQYATVPVPNN